MSAPYSTILLNNAGWDLCVDSAGNIARADAPYAVAQDVASALKTFLGECYYNTAVGVPYLQQFLGFTPPLSVLQAALANAALTVPTVASAVCVIESFKNRQVTGQVQFTTDSGLTGSVAL